MNDNRISALPLFLSGLGAGIALTLLMASRNGVATRRLIGRQVKGGEEWMKAKAAEAENYVQTRSARLRDGVAAVADAVARS